MEDQAINQGSSSDNASEKTPESTVELNIKTLDSQTYTFKVNKNVRNLSSLYLKIIFASIVLHLFFSLVCLSLIRFGIGLYQEPVSLFKEKIASEIGVPVGQQRLIFRGRVLKDDHPLSEYRILLLANCISLLILCYSVAVALSRNFGID